MNTLAVGARAAGAAKTAVGVMAETTNELRMCRPPLPHMSGSCGLGGRLHDPSESLGVRSCGVVLGHCKRGGAGIGIGRETGETTHSQEIRGYVISPQVVRYPHKHLRDSRYKAWDLSGSSIGDSDRAASHSCAVHPRGSRKHTWDHRAVILSGHR